MKIDGKSFCFISKGKVKFLKKINGGIVLYENVS